MGVPWLAQVRLLHLAVLAITLLSLVLYVAYMPAQQLSTTSTPMAGPLGPLVHHHLLATPQECPTCKNDTSPLARNSSSEQPPLNISSTPDITRGIPAQIIYEAGHNNGSSGICPELGKGVQILILITSAPSHDVARMAIRQTWGHYAARRDISIAFILGRTADKELSKKIDKEEYIYGDVIRGRFVDAYENLTLKTISILEWVDSHCPNAAFVLKTDDDMFVNVPRLHAFTLKHSPEQQVIYGRLARKWKPIHNKKSKYFISPQQYKMAVFPDFTTGPAYLFPAALARVMYPAALKHTYLKLEDVFVTGIVASDLKIKRTHAPEFLNKRVSLTACNVQSNISIHNVKVSEQFDLWKKLLDGHTKCKNAGSLTSSI